MAEAMFDFSQAMREGCAKMGLSLSDTCIAKLKTYCDFLLEYNQKVNLTAITEPAEIVQKHFLDCLFALRAVPENAVCADIGTGAGFPGAVLAIARPDITMHLFDSLKKRLVFLDELCERLDVKNCASFHFRAEDAGRAAQFREKYDRVFSRAVARMSVLAELTLPFAAVGGYAAAMKGPSAEAELKDASRALSLLGAGKPQLLHTDELGGLSHCLVLLPKERPTPKAYPRKAGTPEKSPI